MCGFWDAGQGATTRERAFHSKELQSRARPQKTRNPPSVAQAHPEGEGQMAQKAFVDHKTELKNEQLTLGFRIIPQTE